MSITCLCTLSNILLLISKVKEESPYNSTFKEGVQVLCDCVKNFSMLQLVKSTVKEEMLAIFNTAAVTKLRLINIFVK